jgi:hypothetical protein
MVWLQNALHVYFANSLYGRREMTSFKFSESAETALDFAMKLRHGTVNFHTDYESENLTLVQVDHNTTWFNTDVVWTASRMLQDFEWCGMRATDKQTNIDSLRKDREIRHITVLGKSAQTNWREVEILTFDVVRDYLDGDTVEGWTAWHPINASITSGNRNLKLRWTRVQWQGEEICVWGQDVHPTTTSPT